MLSRRLLLGSLAAGVALAPAERLIGKPRRGGRIRVAGIVASTSDTLDPARAGNSSDFMRMFLLYSGLMQYDRGLAVRPGLAESVESTDNVVWTIRLRRGVQFHNGKLLDAGDVVH
ncbi:MAG: ABC transporter substrate-binding protein, partial [Novosphingobium sp.]